MKTTRGWMQGYNAEAVVGDGQNVLVADISTESLDTANLEPMVRDALQELEAVGVSDTPEVVLADAGYRTNDAIEALCGDGIPTLVGPDADRHKNRGPGAVAASMTRLHSAGRWRPSGGMQLYLRRQGSIDPVFGQVKSNRREPLPAPRQISRQICIAAADGHPQPAQASPPPARHRLTGGEPLPRHPR